MKQETTKEGQVGGIQTEEIETACGGRLSLDCAPCPPLNYSASHARDLEPARLAHGLAPGPLGAPHTFSRVACSRGKEGGVTTEQVSVVAYAN